MSHKDTKLGCRTKTLYAKQGSTTIQTNRIFKSINQPRTAETKHKIILLLILK